MITVVSGVPRSGTSLMMQMLKSGGMTILADSARKPDIHNPRGYYEYEKVKSVQKDNRWLNEAEGKAVKIIAPLLAYLPSDFEYRVLFMERPLQEAVRSQQKMLGRSDTDSDFVSRLCTTFDNQIQRIRHMIQRLAYIDVLYIHYKDVIQNPLNESNRINRFLGGGLNIKKMIEVVDPELWHERSESGSFYKK